MLSIAEMAEAVGKPASTTRDYLRRFKMFLRTKKVAGGRHAKYTNEALDLLKAVLKGYEEGLSTDELRERLKSDFPIIGEGEIIKHEKTNDSEHRQTSLDVVVQGQLEIYRSIEKLFRIQTEVLKQNSLLLKQNSEILKQFETEKRTSPKTAKRSVKRAMPAKAKNKPKKGTTGGQKRSQQGGRKKKQTAIKRKESKSPEKGIIERFINAIKG